jgi:hypothetical protein
MMPILLRILACALLAAGALRPGERLATAAGEAVVESVTVQPGERRVSSGPRWYWSPWLEEKFGLLQLKWDPSRLPHAKA